MTSGKYILVNGTFVSAENYRISLAESEGILFSEKIRAIRTALPFFRETLELIKYKMFIFNQSFPEFTENKGAEMKRQLERTLTKNKQFMGAILTIVFSVPDEKMTYTIRTETTPFAGFELNEKGIYARIFNQVRKSASDLSHLSIGSELFWNISKHHLLAGQPDCFLIMNVKDQIIEASESNLYLISGKQVRGVSKEQGAYLDITRTLLISVFKDLNLEYSENEGITIQNIRETEEIFTINAITGIQWIIGFEGKRFFNHTIRKISELFNQRLIQ